MTRSGNGTSAAISDTSCERGSQSAVTDGAHQFETVRTATRGFARICQALDDDFKKGAFHVGAAGRE